MSNQHEAKAAIESHGKTIDELHHKLEAMHGVDKEKLHAAVSKFKAAHKAFLDDAQAWVRD